MKAKVAAELGTAGFDTEKGGGVLDAWVRWVGMFFRHECRGVLGWWWGGKVFVAAAAVGIAAEKIRSSNLRTVEP